jgi:hypothetical protein
MIFKNRPLALSILISFALISCGGGSETAEELPTKISYIISTSVNDGGTISPLSATIEMGTSTSFSLSPNEGYEVTSATGCSGTLNGTTYSIDSAVKDCSISVIFSQKFISQPEHAPKISVLFPAKKSLLFEKESGLTFKGIATDSSGVKSVRINGIEAELTPIEKNIAKELTRISANTNTSKTTAKESPVFYPEEVSWQVTLPSVSASTIYIETEDTQGNINSKANSITLLYNTYKTPSNFTIDATNNRLIGKVSHNSFNTFNLVNNETSTYTVQQSQVSTPFAYYAKENIILDTNITDNTINLQSIDLTSGQTNIVATLDLNVDHQTWDFINLQKIEVVQDQDIAYLLLNYISTVDQNDDKSKILAYDFPNKTLTTVIDKKTTNDKIVDASSFSYSENGLLTIDHDYTRVNEVQLDASDSTILLTDNDTIPVNIVTDLIDNFAYIAGYNAITKVNLTTYIAELLSLETEAGELTLSRIGSIGIDKENNQLLIGEGPQGIIGINLDTGKRKVVVRDGIGQGSSFIAPRAMVSDKERKILYVADDGGEASAFVAKVDLITGDRVRIVELEDNFNAFITGMAFDETNNKLYITFGDDILYVDLSNNSVSVLSSNSVGYGVVLQDPLGSELDLINNRLITFDNANDALIAIDLDNGNRTILSSSLTNAEVGSGIEISRTSSIAIDTENQIAYASSQYYAHVIKIDLATGERSLLIDSCKTESGSESLVQAEGMWSSYYHAEAKELFLYSKGIISYNIESQKCYQTPSLDLLDMVPTLQYTAYVSDFNNIYLLDLKTGSKVIISK